MQKLLFIGHEYHKKTKSADFVLDLLSEKFDITKFYFDPYTQNINKAFDKLFGKKYDVVVIWQVTPDIKKLQKKIKCNHFVYFPMYDQMEFSSNEFWYDYDKVKIISFSKTLSDRLIKLGLDCKYIQYFPKPIEHKKIQNKTSVFFWQRVNSINIDTVLKLFKNIKISCLHMHKAIDPKNTFKDIKNSKIKVTYSDWFENKSELTDKIQDFSIYIAPRPSEGIGMSFLEAMAMGRCVVAPDKATMNEYIIHGKTGILYKWGKQINSLEKFDAKIIGENAYKYIKSGYTKWNKEKYKIFDWCIEPVKSQLKKPCNKYYLLGLPILKIEEK